MVSRREFIGISAGVVGGLVVGAAATLLVRPSTAGTTTEGGTGTVTQTVTSTTSVGAGQTATVTSTATQTETAIANLGDLGTLVIGANLSPLAGLDPAQAPGADPGWIAVNNAYEDFLQFHYPDFSYVGPALLQSVTQSTDGLTWTGTLTQGAKFADGTPITSADLVYTVQRGLRLFAATEVNLAGPYFGFIGITQPNQITAPDANTIQVTLPIAYTPSLVQATMCDLVWGVVNQKMVAANSKTITSTGSSTSISDEGHAWMSAGNSAGSGPFVITESVAQDHLTMVANPNYWGSPKPRLKEVIFKHVASADSELVLLQKGEIDVMYDAKPAQIAANQYNEGVLASSSPQATTSFLWLNPSQAPFNAGPAVWNAVKAAIDYTGLINNVMQGAGVNVQTLSWKGLPGYDANDPYQQDPAQVKQLLTQAGFPNGISFNLIFNTDDAISTIFPPKLQQDFAACGMNVTLQGMSGGGTNTARQDANFQALTTYEGGGLQHIANNAWWNLDPRSGFFAKWVGFNNTTAEQLVDATKTATGADFLSACQAMTEWALNNCPSVSLFQRTQAMLMSSSVAGLVMPFSRLNLQLAQVYKQGVKGFS